MSDKKERDYPPPKKAFSVIRQDSIAFGAANFNQTNVNEKRGMDMSKKRVFISFDVDHDEGTKIMLAGQAKHGDSPFDFIDASVKEPLAGDWKEKVRRRMANIDVVIVLCGEYTHLASGVAAEVTLAREEGVPYFLLWAYADKNCTKPTTAKAEDKVYKWTWDALKALIDGSR